MFTVAHTEKDEAQPSSSQLRRRGSSPLKGGSTGGPGAPLRTFWKSLLPVLAGLRQIFWLPLLLSSLEFESCATARRNRGTSVWLHQGKGTGSLKPLHLKHCTSLYCMQKFLICEAVFLALEGKGTWEIVSASASTSQFSYSSQG